MKRFCGPAIAAGLLLLILASLVWLKEYQPFPRVDELSVPPKIALRLDDAEIAGRSDGRLLWRFKARTVEISRDRVYTTFTGISRGTVYGDGKPALRLSGHKALYNSFTRDIQGSGGIRAHAPSGLGLRTDRFSWNAYQQKLFCPARVTIVTKAGKGSAERLYADLRTDEVILENARMRIPVEEELLK